MRKAKVTKDLTKPIRKEKVIKLPISKFIDTKFRDYAVYVLESRGIPNFYDALTPVQRFIVKNSPSSWSKTLSVVGRSIEDGYHHGNTSLEGAINKLARPFGNAMQILEGSGFFGNEVSPSPAAARYTSVRLASVANGILNKYNYLTTREPEGPYDPLWMDCPLGLVSPIVGIAVGYKSTILPRKLKEIQEFLAGKRKNLKPYFEGFQGTIEKFKGAENSWLISSKVIVEDRKLLIREIPPIIKYESILKKLDHLINKYENSVRIVNNSNKTINIDIVYTGKNKEDWEAIQNYIHKTFAIIVSENVVFVKDGAALIYDSVEQYLEDYKWQVARLNCKNLEYEQTKLNFDLRFNIAKELFISFILVKKRSVSEIDEWYKTYDKDVAERLERMTTKKFTIDELKETRHIIIELTKALKDKKIEHKSAEVEFAKYEDPTLKRGIVSRKNAVSLFESDDMEMLDGVMVWNGGDVYDNDTKEEDEDE